MGRRTRLNGRGPAPGGGLILTSRAFAAGREPGRQVRHPLLGGTHHPDIRASCTQQVVASRSALWHRHVIRSGSPTGGASIDGAEQTPSRRATHRGPRRRRTASPVTVTRPDGTVTTEPAYTPRQLAAIDRKAARTPRTWDEANGDHGGGADFGTRRR